MLTAKRPLNLNDFGKDVKRHKALTENELERFATGAIIKVKMKNFVTYSLTEFTLSPSLNMIIGPNGTGKSTFVCAVCLGLAGHPTLLGRQKALSGFIKNGEDSASIEITLKGHPGEANVVIARDIYQNNKSEWRVDNRSTSEAKVKTLLQTFNIQLDNLCQFLPQEKVADFAKLSPEKLLQETQRAIDIELLKKYENLISLNKERTDMKDHYEAKVKEKDDLLEKKDRLQEEAKKYEEFKKKQNELDNHQKLIPYAEMQDMKRESDRLKRERNEIKAELEKFEIQTAPYEDAIDNFQAEKDKCLNAIHDKKAKLDDHQQIIDDGKSEIEKGENVKIRLKKMIDNLNESVQKKKEKAQKCQDAIDEYTQRLLNLPQYDQKKLEQCEQHNNELHDKITDVQTQVVNKKDELSIIKHEIERSRTQIRSFQQQLQSKDRIHVLDNNPNNLSRATQKAVRLLRGELRKFKSNVFEPPCLTVSSSSEEYSAYLEELADPQTTLALTASSKEAFEVISHELYDKHKISVAFRYLSNVDLRPSLSSEQLKDYGFDGYLRDFLTGPKEVIQMLAENSFIHDVPVSSRPLTDAQIERLRRPGPNGQLIFRKFFSGGTLFNLKISKYGHKQVTVSTSSVKMKPRLFSTGGITEERKIQINKQIETEKNRISSAEERLGPIREYIAELEGTEKELNVEFEESDHFIKESKRTRKNQTKYETKIFTYTKERDTLLADVQRDNSAEIYKYEQRINAVLIRKMHFLTQIADSQCEFNRISRDITLLEVKRFEEENKIISVKNLTKTFEEEKKSLERQLDHTKREIQKLKQSNIRKELQQKTATYDVETKEILADLITKYTSENRFTKASVEAITEGIESELKLLGNSSKSSISNLKNIVDRLQVLETDIDDFNEKLANITQVIKVLHSEWEPKLMELIQKISTKFSKIFPTVGIAGEVRVTKAEEYQNWRLEILVKFRETGELKVLDSHTQSGGERAVSTVYYMISMQELTASPFRTVDEINQGMDARNERIVHKHMVEVACQENSSQYFLITPKLLTNLYYANNMRVHCIMAGPFTPNPSENPEYLSLGASCFYE